MIAMNELHPRLRPFVVGTENGCWLWTRSTTKGYGKIRLNGAQILVHRLAYESAVGPIPDGLTIDHLCRVRGCVNPAHLEAITRGENTLRGETISARNAVKTHCVNGHEFTAENTRVADGHRACRACQRARAAKYGHPTRQRAKA